MPSNLDFDTTKQFRDFILGKTLNRPNGPQTFTQNTYSVQKLGVVSNIDLGNVDDNRKNDLAVPTSNNIFKPSEYLIKDTIDTLPRRANLSLYYESGTYFKMENHSLIGIMGSTSKYETESELFKFAASYIKNDKGGPVLSRIARNIETATNGRAPLIDALNGSVSTASNIITGRQPLISPNYKITVAKTLPGKAIDFLQTVAGVEFPWSEVPGDYLTNPLNPINVRPTPTSQLGAIFQDVTGALGSLIGIQRRPKETRKPSDLFIEYMGEGQKQILFDLLSYNKSYAPNYSTTARSQNSSKVFNFVDKVAQGVKNILGLEAPTTGAYIGDDRGDDVKWVMNDMAYGRPYRSSYYLTLMFDPIAAELFHRSKNIGDQGSIGGNLTWVSTNTLNKRGVNNNEYGVEQSNLENSLSTKFGFRNNSILDVTQQILNSMPKTGGEARSHVGNVIDQTSRVFKDGDVMISRGSAVKYTDKFNQETGVEYCRVWTKDRGYFNYSDTMKRTANIRKFDGSVMGGDSRPWNLNIGPISNGNKGFDGSTNIMDNYPYGPDKDGKKFYAKKYMFSIENLAWKSSNANGFRVTDLPFCERGPNGGRVMWFPPYDLKVSEQNSARWESNTFLGRPEPIYTYQNTERSGTISFKVVVDHPSILNLLVREHFKNMSSEVADNYINAFFSGCKEIDFYNLITTYTTLDPSDIELILQYLNEGGSPIVIPQYGTSVEPTVTINPAENPVPGKGETITLNVDLKYLNDEPNSGNGGKTTKGGKNADDYSSPLSYSELYDNNVAFSGASLTNLENILNTIYESTTTKNKNDKKLIFGEQLPNVANKVTKINEVKDRLTKQYTKLKTDFDDFTKKMETLKLDISGSTVDDVTIDVLSSCSAVAENGYNFKLSMRRSHSILRDILKRVAATYPSSDKWEFKELPVGSKDEKVLVERKFTYKDLGYDREGSLTIRTLSAGENVPSENGDCHKSDFNNLALKINSPVAFGCRQSFVRMSYTQVPKPEPAKPPVTTNTNGEPPKTKLDRIGEITSNPKPRKPTIDVMKRIIMKTLSESYYFKKLEEDSPVAFSSLKEKLRYFHPGFHSTTPEGLNSRLTFLHQCIRPGDTIPIKGLTDTTDINARNTTFGPPPICVLRIGDFYHSKIVIRDVGITFDEATWDLNPEGIGVQPMIANVSLQVNFIGGQGLEKPIEKLQNALSSNFYANTEMYDERSSTTNLYIGGETASGFTKSFLETLQKFPSGPVSGLLDNKGNKITEGEYIGTSLSGGTHLNYAKAVSNLYEKTEAYFKTFESTYQSIEKEYGSILTSMVFSKNYRPINYFRLNTDKTHDEPLDIFGLYDNTNDLPILARGLKENLISAIETLTPSNIFEYGTLIPENSKNRANEILSEFLTNFVEEKVGKLVENQSIKSFEKSRNELISALDRVNYITKYGYDVKFQKGLVFKATLTGLETDTSGFYSKYSDCITYIKDNNPKMYSNIDNTVDFTNPVVDTQVTKNILSIILSEEKTNMSDVLTKDVEDLISASDVEKINGKIEDLIKTEKVNKFKFKKFSKRKDSNDIAYPVLLEDLDTKTDEITKLFSDKVEVTTELNYYK